SIAPTSSDFQSGRSGVACTGKVAVKCQSSSSEPGSSKSYSGWATGRTRVCAAAFQNQPPIWLSIASVMRRSRPTFWTRTRWGTLPLRNPGTLTLCARSDAACSTAWCTSSDGTCTVRRTRFSGSSSTCACTRTFKQTPSGPGRVGSATLRLFLLTRHAHSALNVERRVNGDPGVPVPLTPDGRAEAELLGHQLSQLPLDLCVHTRFDRT